MTTRLILDVDTGTDDAVAIFAAAGHPELELLGVTAVNGNVELKYTVENSLRVLDHVGATVPVYAGADRPFVRPDFPIPRRVLNGDEPEFQINELPFPPSRTPVQAGSAVQYLIDSFMGDGGDEIVLVAVGPLTNVALALIAEPRLAQRISRLVIMGGARGFGGNVTASAEFNFWVDPEAAEAVLSAGIRDVTIVPLDATHSAELGYPDCDAFDAIGTPAATGAASLIRHRIENYHDVSEPTTAVHDAICIALLVEPDVLTEVVEAAVHVETRGERTLGEMVVDTRPWRTEAPNAKVALRADARVFSSFLADAFRS